MKFAVVNYAIASIHVFANLAIQSSGYQVLRIGRQDVFDSGDCSRRKTLWKGFIPGGGTPIAIYPGTICTTDQCTQPHPSCPNYYFFCNTMTILAQCGAGKNFEHRQHKCYKIDTNGLGSSPENNDDECNKPGIFPVVNSNGAKYSLCLANNCGYTRFDYNCPSWARFNPVTKMCEIYIPPEQATTAKPAKISPPATVICTTESAATGSITALNFTRTKKSSIKVSGQSTTRVALPEQLDNTKYTTTVDATESSIGTKENITTESTVTGSITASDYTTTQRSTVQVLQESTNVVTVLETSKGRNTSPGQQCRESKMRERDDNFLGVCNIEDPSERCRELMCARESGDLTFLTKGGPALDGTWCGDKKICWQGSCVIDTQPPKTPLKIDDFLYTCDEW